MVTPGKSYACFTRRRVFIAFISLCVFILLCYVIREKYFFRADVLLAISSRVDSDSLRKMKAETVWDVWMKHQNQKHYISIGDIYDKCDNKTRTKIGKVVLKPKDNGEEGVQIKSYLNQTYKHDITASTSKMVVYYNDEILYTKNNDMCEVAKTLDTPYTCPVKAGHLLVIKDVAKLPSYIPKGKYRVSSIVYDQDNNEIGCTFIDFKTGESK